MKEILRVSNLTIQLQKQKIVQDISFSLKPGKILAIVGESGSGKSLIAKSLLRLNNENLFSYPKGKIIYDNKDLLSVPEVSLCKYRGKELSLIMQDPFVSLNPVHNIRKQISETLLQHKLCSVKEVYSLVDDVLKQVGLEDLLHRKKIYPHHLSGGQRQRVMIALNLISKPKILIADEPTTSLDPKVQNDIIDLLLKLKKQLKISLIFISHDLHLIKKVADDILIISGGKSIEYNKSTEIFTNPQKSYTKKLLAAMEFGFLKHKIKKFSNPLLEVTNLSISYNLGHFLQKKKLEIVKDLSFQIYPGETLGLVGISGSGKSSIARAILKLQKIDSGKIIFDNVNLLQLDSESLRRIRKDIQIVFQDPFATLNPKMTIYQILKEGLIAHKIENSDFIINQTIEDVRLKTEFLNRYPHQFSGGQRQRISIARSLCLSPKFIIFDEATASLDVTSQKDILDLLVQLQQRYNLAYLFISHNKKVVDAISHRKIYLS